MPADKGTGSRNARRARRPDQIHDRPTALTKRQQYEQAEARREAAAQTPKGATARQRNIIAQEEAREPARYRADVRRQVANPSIADRLAGGFFQGAASGLGLDSLVDDAVWSFTHPKERLTDKGRAAGPDMMIWPGMGKGPGPVKTGPRVGPNTLEEHVESVLPEARRMRAKQEAGYRSERGKRVSNADEARIAAGGGEAGARAAVRELAGELPKLKFGALTDLSQASRDKLFDRIGQDMTLTGFDRINAEDALRNILAGKTPTHGDILWLERMFGTEVAREAVKHGPWTAKLRRSFLSVINLPRAMKSTLDFSWTFRQGLVLGARHPTMFKDVWGKQFRSFASEDHYNLTQDAIRAHRRFPEADKAGLALTDLERMALREEGYQSDLAERLPLGAGKTIRRFGRAYGGAGNEERFNWFVRYLDDAEMRGKPLSATEQAGIAEFLNVATGRGGATGGWLQKHSQGLNALFFSPQLIASRLKLLNPAWYYSLPPVARKEALQAMLHLAGLASGTLALVAQIPGVDVELDPRSSDWGKIRLGDTRIDILGGLGQYIVLGARIAANEYKREGTVVPYEGGFGGMSRYKAALDFTENKVAPVPAYFKAWGEGENRDFEPFNPSEEKVFGRGPTLPVGAVPWAETGKLFLPLGVEGSLDTYGEYGPRPAAAALGLGGVGFGVQTYSSSKPKKRSKSKSKSGPGSRRAKRPGSGSGGRRARRPD